MPDIAITSPEADSELEATKARLRRLALVPDTISRSEFGRLVEPAGGVCETLDGKGLRESQQVDGLPEQTQVVPGGGAGRDAVGAIRCGLGHRGCVLLHGLGHDSPSSGRGPGAAPAAIDGDGGVDGTSSGEPTVGETWVGDPLPYVSSTTMPPFAADDPVSAPAFLAETIELADGRRVVEVTFGAESAELTPAMARATGYGLLAAAAAINERPAS